MIKVNYTELNNIRTQLHQLSLESIFLTDPLLESMGRANDREKEIIALLLQLCNKDLPELFTNTSKLLESIGGEFNNSESVISNTVIGGIWR